MNNTQIVQDWLTQFETHLSTKNVRAVLDLFAPECYWRDLLSFTWNIKTLEGQEQITHMLNFCLKNIHAYNWQVSGNTTCNTNIIESLITFETDKIMGYGYIRLINTKCWTLFTMVHDLKHYIEPTWNNIKPQYTLNITHNKPSMGDAHFREQNELRVSQQPFCLIVGGGHSGIMLAARLKQLNVSTLVIHGEIVMISCIYMIQCG